MDQAEIITTVLVSAVTSLVEPAVKDAYTSLKNLIKEKFQGKETVVVALDNIEESPTVWKPPLEDALRKVKVEQDIQIVTAANELAQILKTIKGTMYTERGDILMDNSRKISIQNGDYIEGDKKIK